MQITDFESMAPMKYYDNAEPTAASAIQKRQDIIDNKDNLYVASVKHDGDWGCFIHYEKGRNLIRSRSISKVTGAYGDYTAKLPAICAIMDQWPDNTVVLAELCLEGGTANTIGTILRCLPEKAVERQKTTPVICYAFDLLMWNGEDYTNKPYIQRLLELEGWLAHADWKQFVCTTVYADGWDFAEEADRIISEGGEGLVIQRKDNPYLMGTRTAWKTLKLKQKMPEMEVRVLATLKPSMYYEGDCPDSWEYWYQDMPNANSQAGDFPVTKPFFYGWKNGVTVKLDNGEECDVTSGLTDDDREWLATNEAQVLINNGALYAVVRAMSYNSRGKLRHPVFVRFRYPEEM